jgi:hypothetical protein
MGQCQPSGGCAHERSLIVRRIESRRRVFRREPPSRQRVLSGTRSRRPCASRARNLAEIEIPVKHDRLRPVSEVNFCSAERTAGARAQGRWHRLLAKRRVSTSVVVVAVGLRSGRFVDGELPQRQSSGNVWRIRARANRSIPARGRDAFTCGESEFDDALSRLKDEATDEARQLASRTDRVRPVQQPAPIDQTRLGHGSSGSANIGSMLAVPKKRSGLAAVEGRGPNVIPPTCAKR